MKWLLLAALLALAGSASADPALSCTVECAEKSSGVCAAPAFVFLDCTATTDDSDSDVRPFHDYRWATTWGDDANPSGQGLWPYGTGVLARNITYSPTAGHVYETAGTFTITTGACDSTPTCDSDEQTVTVVSEDAGWADADSLCVSTSGTTTGCPAGVSVTTSSDFDATMLTSAGKRTLYRCGETFTMGSNVSVSDAGANASLVGGYGSCSGNPALITKTVDGNGSLMGANLDHWRFRDLQITDTTDESTADTVLLSGQTSTGSHVNNFMVLRVATLGMSNCGGTVSRQPTQDTYPELNAAFEYRCELTKSTANWGWINFMSTSKSMIVGSRFENVRTLGESRTDTGGRMTGNYKTAFFSNDFYANTAISTAQLTMRGSQDPATLDQYFSFSWNHHHNDTQDNLWNFDASTDGTNNPGLSSDYMVEGNLMTFGSSYTRGDHNGITAYTLNSVPDATLRNNITDYRGLTDTAGGDGGYSAFAFGTEPPNDVAPVRQSVYNNTVLYADSGTLGPTLVQGGTATSSVARNNVQWAENTTNDEACSGAGFTCSNNAFLNQSAECPFAGADGSCDMTGDCAEGWDVDLDCFAIRASGGGRASVVNAGLDFPDTAVGGMVGYVAMDAFGNCRPDATEWDIGAHEYGAAACESGAEPEPDTPLLLRGAALRGGRLR